MSGVNELLQTIGERVGGALGVRNVYGEPIHAQGRTIIPVARVNLGFGAGGGGAKEGNLIDGGGGGGGGRATPVGVVEITADSTRLVRFRTWRPIAIAASAGFLLGLAAGLRRAH